VPTQDFPQRLGPNPTKDILASIEAMLKFKPIRLVT